MLAINTVLQERYRIVRPLGQGGMGAVYEAIDGRFGTPVALKEILIELDNLANEQRKNSIIQAFEREAKSLAKAKHEAVPYVRDYFTELGRQFLVMELVEGDDLAVLLGKRKSAFPLEEVVDWADQLLDALDYLHNLDPPIIHRDIKPQNLKLNFRRKIKLLDFGIAKSGEKNSTITNPTFVGATLNYSPIEQILRVVDPMFREFIILKHKEKAKTVLGQNSDARTDIYAVGATFYHLLTNRLPADATRRTLEVWEGKADPLKNPSELNSKIPASISGWLLKAMEVDFEERFSSAVEMQTVLHELLAAENKPETAEEQVPQSFETFVAEGKNDLHEHQLMQAETEKLVDNSNENARTEADFLSEIQSAPTQSSFLEIPDTRSSTTEPVITEPFPIKSFDTQPAGSISKSELSKAAVFDEILIDNKRITSENLPVSKIKTASKFNPALLFWLLPVTALGILTVGGIGGIIWLSSSDSTSANKSATKIVISTPTATISPTVTVSPTASPNVPPTPEQTPNKPDKSNEKMKTSIPAKPSKTPLQSPIKMPPPPKIPKSPKRTYSDDCVYNRKCG